LLIQQRRRNKKMKIRLILTIATSALVIQAPFANADTFTSKGDGATRQWDSVDSWDCVGCSIPSYPQSGDTATILETDVIYISGNTQVVASLTLQSSNVEADVAVLEFRSGSQLNVETSLNAQSNLTYPAHVDFATGTGGSRPVLNSAGSGVTISGLVQSIDTAEGAVTRDSANTFSLNSGSQIAANGGDIEISAVMTINSGAEILAASGDLTVSGPVTINGIARATGSVDLIFTTNQPAAASTGLVHVDSASARVIFDSSSGQTFTGALDFYVEAGEMLFNDSVTTAGGTRMESGGMINVPAGESFQSTGSFTGP
jgi:hypothetical protein